MNGEDDTRPDGESELVQRLRRRADELRAAYEAEVAATRSAASEEPESEPESEPEPEPEPEAEPEPGPELELDPATLSDAARLEHDTEDFVAWADAVDSDHRDLLTQWADEEHVETESPRRNWSPVIALVVIAAAIGLIVLAFLFVLDDDGDDGTVGTAGEDAEAPSVLDEDPPTLEDLTAEVTVPPGPAEGLAIADRGFTIVEDRFDPARREGTFAVVIDNPHENWLAQGVQVDVSFLGAGGAELGGDSAFIEVVLPAQRVAVGALFFDAPTEPVTELAVSVDVARWRESGAFEGEFTTSEVTTEEAEFSGVRTTFVLRSSFPDPLTDVGVTAVYRDAVGRIVGGSDTFVDLLEPGTDTPMEISLLANIALEAIASTELYPTAGFGFVPDEG